MCCFENWLICLFLIYIYIHTQYNSIYFGEIDVINNFHHSNVKLLWVCCACLYWLCICRTMLRLYVLLSISMGVAIVMHDLL